MLRLLALVLGVVVAAGELHGEEEGASKTIAGVIDDFHDAAAKADGARYFGNMTEDAVFLGTDATERWPRAEFEAFARPYFDEGKGWTYTTTQRHVHVESTGSLAWFDELLDNASYGTCRGSGVLRREGDRWRIAQYNLSIPIPNPLARNFVARIRAHEKERAPETVVYLVRHAEKESGDDPGLTEAGHRRAAHLCRVLRSADVRYVFDTQYKRTQQTVAPLAEHLTIEPTRYKAHETKALAGTLRTMDAKGAVLVAGHSDTLPGLLKHLGISKPVSIADGDYDNLFVVTITAGGPSRLQWLHFGR